MEIPGIYNIIPGEKIPNVPRAPLVSLVCFRFACDPGTPVTAAENVAKERTRLRENCVESECFFFDAFDSSTALDYSNFSAIQFATEIAKTIFYGKCVVLLCLENCKIIFF